MMEEWRLFKKIKNNIERKYGAMYKLVHVNDDVSVSTYIIKRKYEVIYLTQDTRYFRNTMLWKYNIRFLSL